MAISRAIARPAALMCALLCGVATVAAAETVRLAPADETRVRRFLHPLPRELHLHGAAFRLPAQECGLETAADAAPIEKQIADDFRARWQKRFGAELKPGGSSLRVVAGTIGTTASLRKAAERGLFDAKYLAERRNPEQAYAIATETDGKSATVHIAANDAPGLYYGLVTFEQLLDGLSTREALVFPHAAVVDWPNVKRRGSWTVPREEMPEYCRWKCNWIEAWHLSIRGKDDQGRLDVQWTFPKEFIEEGRRCGATVFPGTGHISRHAGTAAAKELFPNAAATKDDRPQALCYGSPDACKLVDAYVEAIARKYDFADVWLSELEGPKGGCQCQQCKGDLRNQFVNEVKAILGAYEKARKANPNFRIMIGLTQGSAPHTHDILRLIPKDIPLNYYDGKVTYRATFQKYNLPPKAHEIKRQGYFMGSTNSPGQTEMIFPFVGPSYCRMLCSEAGDLDLDFVLAEFWPSPLFHLLNAQAMAEFLWNPTGRTVEEFTIAWALRQGLDNPEETAKVIGLIEYPSRGLRNTSGREVFPAIVSFVTGEKEPSDIVMYGFESRDAEEAARALALCDEAVARAGRLKDPKLLADCRQVRYWMFILERCMACVGKKADDPAVVEAKTAVRDAFRGFPKSLRAWLARNPLPETAAATVDRRVTELCKQWRPIFKENEAKLPPRAKALIEEFDAGKLGVHRLPVKWSFRTDKDNKGAAARYYSGLPKDLASWETLRSDLDGGWETQGHADYTGPAWYSIPWFSVLPSLRDRKQIYLYLNAIHGAADVYVNAEKAHAIEAGAAGPVCFDVRPFIKPGERGFTVSVCVRGEGATRGVVGPAYLIGCDAPAATEDLAPLVEALP